MIDVERNRRIAENPAGFPGPAGPLALDQMRKLNASKATRLMLAISITASPGRSARSGFCVPMVHL